MPSRKFMAALQGKADDGDVWYGNAVFDTDEPVTVKLLDKVKEVHCENLRKMGAAITADNMSVVSLIELEG